MIKQEKYHDIGFYEASADYVRRQMPWQPEIGLILGSSMGGLTEMMDIALVIPYVAIPNFLNTTVSSHAGELIFGTVAGRKIVCMSGRFHYYEGYDIGELVLPVRLFKLLGVQVLIMTNAAGAVNPAYHPGDVMIVTDHIKLPGISPLRGPNVDAFGPRFCDMSTTYTPELRRMARDCARTSPIIFHEGVYMYFSGPQFETPAEIRAAGILGADAIGMSTVAEAITAAHCGMPLLTFSVITNMAAGVRPDQTLSLAEIDDITAMIDEDFRDYLNILIRRIGEEIMDGDTL